jgi:hypothetical protein
MKTENELKAAIDAELDRDLLIAIFGSLSEDSRRSIARSMNESVLRRNHVIHQELVDESAREISGTTQQQDSGEGQSQASELTKELSLRQRAWGDLRDRLKL